MKGVGNKGSTVISRFPQWYFHPLSRTQDALASGDPAPFMAIPCTRALGLVLLAKMSLY